MGKVSSSQTPPDIAAATSCWHVVIWCVRFLETAYLLIEDEDPQTLRSSRPFSLCQHAAGNRTDFKVCGSQPVSQLRKSLISVSAEDAGGAGWWLVRKQGRRSSNSRLAAVRKSINLSRAPAEHLIISWLGLLTVIGTKAPILPDSNCLVTDIQRSHGLEPGFGAHHTNPIETVYILHTLEMICYRNICV